MPGAGHGNGGGEGGLPLARLPPDLPPQPRDAPGRQQTGPDAWPQVRVWGGEPQPAEGDLVEMQVLAYW